MVGTPRKRARREAAAQIAQGLAPTVIIPDAPPRGSVNLMSLEEYEEDKRRPHVAYTETLAAEVLVAIACGVSIAALARVHGMPSRRTIYQWRKDRLGFAEKLEEAFRHRAEQRMNILDGILEDVAAGRMDPHAGKMVFDGHKWLAAKENIKYSDTQKIELTGANGGAIKIDDPAGRLELARWISLKLKDGEAAAAQLGAAHPMMIEGAVADVER